jgi:hypothetical protein
LGDEFGEGAEVFGVFIGVLRFEVEVVAVLGVEGFSFDVLHEVVDVMGVDEGTVGFDEEGVGDVLAYFSLADEVVEFVEGGGGVLLVDGLGVDFAFFEAVETFGDVLEDEECCCFLVGCYFF